MGTWKRFASTVGGRYALVALGALYVALALGWALVQETAGTPRSNTLIVFSMIAGSGVVLLYGGYRLPRTGIYPGFYPTITRWCFSGIGIITVLLALYNVQPADGVTNLDRALLVLTAFSAVAGFGVGIYDARSKTQARELKLRNRELNRTQEQLEETVDRLAESNERLEQFAYAASHDLREPLRMVTSYLTLIRNRYGDDLDDDGEEFFEFAIDGADRMRELIDGLLEYSRVETQGDPFEPVDLNEAVEDVRTDMEVRIAESDAEVDVGELPRVEGDGRQLRRVFQNLMVNAIEYSNGDPRVHVSAEENGGEWLVSVSDEGIGIDPDDQQRIFEVFERLHGQDDHAGTGIGLALTKRIVERHGGEIWVDSEPGVGSTFSFTLSRAPEYES